MEQHEIDKWRKSIDKMSPLEMARLRRFAHVGHPVFDRTLPLYEYFQNRFELLGGMTPELSKALGW